MNSRTDGGEGKSESWLLTTRAPGRPQGWVRLVQEPELTAKVPRDFAYSIPATFLEPSHPVNKYRICMCHLGRRPNVNRMSPAHNSLLSRSFPRLAGRGLVRLKAQSTGEVEVLTKTT
jgi:hypothetical protein